VIHRRRLRLREIDRRLKTEYHADMAAPFSRDLCELLENWKGCPSRAGIEFQVSCEAARDDRWP
jgi:hypothetical protein